MQVNTIVDRVTHVTAYWDDRNGVDQGWYAIAYDDYADGDAGVITDSQKLDWPVDLSAYGEDDADEVSTELAAYFTSAIVAIAD